MVYTSEYADAEYIVTYKMAHMTWKRIVIPSEEYRKALVELLKYGEDHKVVSYLSDGRKTGPVHPDDRKWFQDFAIPYAQRVGLKHAAVVISNDPFRKFYMNAILKVVNIKATYDMKIFTDYDEAFNWLINFHDYID